MAALHKLLEEVAETKVGPEVVWVRACGCVGMCVGMGVWVRVCVWVWLCGCVCMRGWGCPVQVWAECDRNKSCVHKCVSNYMYAAKGRAGFISVS